MTTEQLKQYYADLLILQYSNKEKAIATVKATVDGVVMDQLPLSVQDAFDVDTATGAQLDIIGKYAGISRTVLTFTGQTTLSDTDYRTMIKMAIVGNNSGSSLAEIQNLIFNYLGGALTVFDFANMQLSYYFDSSQGSEELAQAFIKQDMLPKPMGVQLAALIYISNLDNIFGLRTYSLEGYNVSGFNSYADYQTNWPWLSYANAIYQ